MEQALPRSTILLTQARSLRSNIVGDEYETSIWLPPRYETADKAYPTLFVLDSPIVFGTAIPVALGNLYSV